MSIGDELPGCTAVQLPLPVTPPASSAPAPGRVTDGDELDDDGDDGEWTSYRQSSPRRMEVRRCGYCPGTFESARRDQKYCDGTCRQRARRAKLPPSTSLRSRGHHRGYGLDVAERVEGDRRVRRAEVEAVDAELVGIGGQIRADVRRIEECQETIRELERRIEAAHGVRRDAEARRAVLAARAG